MTRPSWCRKELAHILLHHGTEYAAGCRGRAEIEAESVAYIVCHSAGLDSATFSLGYPAHWSDGNHDVIKERTDRVMTTARLILDQAGLLESEPAPSRDAA